MFMNGEQVDVIRDKAEQLLDAYVPFKWGDGKSKQVCAGYSGQGTTCGFLCHWLMWRLGVKDPKRVNWTDADRGLKMTPGQNISRIYLSGAEPFVRCASTGKGIKLPNPLVRGIRPLTGDIVFIFEPSGPQSAEHVFVFKREESRGGELIWHTAEAGQPGAHGSTDSRLRERRLIMPSGQNAANTATQLNEVQEPNFALRRDTNRTIIGWLDIGKLEYIDTAVEDALKPLAVSV